WKTENNGISFTPLFDDQAAMTIGDIAIDWQHDETIWVGTGENNSSRSSYSGTGIYRSTDKGKTWQHLGLGETHHTGRIAIHPQEPNTAWVAAIGHLYSINSARGVYKTTDGGKSWTQSLFIDDTTGVIDLVIDPNNPEVLYAAAWHRMRYAWNFVESGTGSGIYKSTDGGENWDLLTTEESGFPTGNGVGRIGLAIYPQDSKILYASLDNQYRRSKEEDEDQPELSKDSLRTMSSETFVQLSDDAINAYLDQYNFPQQYTAQGVKKMVREGKITPVALVEYVEDANRLLFDTPVIGAEVYRSEDGGKTWKKTHEKYLDATFFSYGYYFGEIRVAPDTPDRIYLLGVPIIKSDDGGKTFKSIGKAGVHADHHALWLSPNKPGHLINGNDGGVNITYDDGENWFKANAPAVGQFYSIAVDMAKPYNVYGGLQDNGVWGGPSTYQASSGWHTTGAYPYKRLYGGDGMQVQVDFRDNSTVYAGSQFGSYSRIDTRTRSQKSIRPRHKLGERPLRFNWQTPILLSRHNQDILYFGANKLFRSMDKGETFQPISGDLTQGGRKGDVPYGTLTTISESPLQFGLLYVGSDDGLIHITRDGGFSWQRISDDLPQNLWVSRVETSKHDTGSVYVSLNGYRFDDFSAYLYRSTDFGQNWQDLGKNLPAEPINVVREDPENPDILYVGTDHALYASLDRGATFMAMFKGMPATPVHDLVVHPRDKDLVVGTHGRSIYIANVEYMQQLTQEMLAKVLHIFPLDEVTYSENWGRRFGFFEPSDPETEIAFYLSSEAAATIRIKSEGGNTLRELSDDSEHGLNYVKYDLAIDSTQASVYESELRAAFSGQEGERFKKLKAADNGNYYLRPGTYTIEVAANGATVSEKLVIKARDRRRRGR
ncbi:MAG: WD40/YVTN/BNR-like repeat-containing protein, partial [bacterium]